MRNCRKPVHAAYLIEFNAAQRWCKQPLICFDTYENMHKFQRELHQNYEVVMKASFIFFILKLKCINQINK